MTTSNSRMNRTQTARCSRGSRCLWASTLRQATALLTFMLSVVPSAQAADYVVRRDGTGHFTTIQACAEAVKAGDTCLVSSGFYGEYVSTKAGGASDAARITFRASGMATVQGFRINHPFVTVAGFDITGYSAAHMGMITVQSGGSHCEILGNRLHDGAPDVDGFYVYGYSSPDILADNCIVRGNTISGLSGTFLHINGDNHLIEGNTLENQNSQDYLRLFGANTIFRRNIVRGGHVLSASGSHPDFAQNFGGAGRKSENHVIEENWFQELTSQFCQLNSGDGLTDLGRLYDNVKNITFRRNVVVSVSHNANVGMPGVRFENNTFYRLAYELSGISVGGSLNRGYGHSSVLKNNVFLSGGSKSSVIGGTSGFYNLSGAALSRQVLAIFVTLEKDATGGVDRDGSIADGIFKSLVSKGYIDANGGVQDPATTLSGLSAFVLDPLYEAYRSATFDVLVRTVEMDSLIRRTFRADFNYVAGSEAAGFPAKKSNGCVGGASATDFNFCESHGINGGSPLLANLANVLGPDGVPFTLDDGLKPLPNSPLCGKGEGGADIGAYSCDPAKVFPSQPSAPANLTIR